MNKKSIPGETLVENFYKLPLFQKIRLFMNEDTEPLRTSLNHVKNET